MKSQRSVRSINSQGGERKVQLPRISEARPSTVGVETYENPFYVPPDEEIFRVKNQELEQKEIERKRVQGLKIWQKGIKNASEGKLRKIAELTKFEDEEDGDEKDGKLNIVEAAKSAIKNRIRHKEPLIDFLNKKREMFLFQMSINEKKEQIKEFEELAYLQEISLQNSKELLEKDAETFKQHIEKNKNETRQAIKNAEDETKHKQKKIQEMKQINEDLSTLMSKNTKQLEKLEKYYNYKEFLDKLTPEEFLKNQKKLKEERKAKSGSVGRKDQGNEDFKWQIYNMNLSPGLLELLNDDDDEGAMFFKRPDQLQEVFETLEEKNLFIIKHAQDIEQSLEDLTHSLAVKKADTLEKKKQLERNKQELKDAIEQRENNINQLCHVTNDKFTESTLDKLETAIKNIYDTSKIFKEGKGEQQVTGLEILRMIERKLDSQLKELKNLPPQKVLEQYRNCVNKRREEGAEQKKREAEEEQKLKREIIKKRMLAQKRPGRPIMAKSMLKKEDKQETVKDEENLEELEKKMFFTLRFQQF